MTPATSHFINTARWMAATFVALHHIHSMFVNQADIMTAPHAPPVFVWWFLTPFAFAHGAVVVFFVLSGFLVGGPAIERARANKRFLRTYLIDRVSRIYIVLIPTLVLTFVLDGVGRHVFAGMDIYEDYARQGLYNPTFLFTTLASLQGIWFSTYGTNVALWSLGMEFWYYIILAFLCLPLSRAYSRWAIWGLFVVGLVLLIALGVSPSYFLLGFGLWCIGVAARIAPRPILRSRWLSLFLWAAVVIVLRLTVRGAQLDQFPVKHMVDGINALLFANVLLTLRFDHSPGFWLCRFRFNHVMSDFSFTLYAIHMPILVWTWAITALIFGPEWRRLIATPLHYAWALGILFGVIGISYCFSRLTEAKTNSVRRWAQRVLPGKKDAPQQMI